jgi:L-threonylcarbamoyladenylate synthase
MAGMTQMYTTFSDVPALQNGAVFACPTDTVYGLSCLARDSAAVLRVKEIKGKTKDMPLIVLIGSLDQLDMFVSPQSTSRVHAEGRLLDNVWPGPVSVVFLETLPMWSTISPDGTLAIRMPHHPELRAFIERVGPIISTSANKTGAQPAVCAHDVLQIFPTELDFIIDGGECNNPPSTLIKILR